MPTAKGSLGKGSEIAPAKPSYIGLQQPCESPAFTLPLKGSTSRSAVPRLSQM
jgi:hypothetical protein